MYKPFKKFKLELWTDASYAPKEDRKSVTGYVIFLNGCLVTAVSKQQKNITTSTAHAETTALFEGLKTLIYIYNLLSQEVDIELPMTIYVDNTASERYCNNDVCSERTRHWDIALKYIYEMKAEGLINIEWVEGTEMKADICTKAMDRAGHEKHRTSMGIY